MTVLVASGTAVHRVDVERKTIRGSSEGGPGRPTCLAADPHDRGAAWCGSGGEGIFRTDDAGRTWRSAGLDDEQVTSVAADPLRPGTLWVGTEPSALWHTDDAGRRWSRREGLLALPSSEEWSFPPKPETHHVRWIACHPHRPGRLWLAIEAGALVSTPDGGRSWEDRVAGGPRDTHELALHPDRPDVLRVAAGDGYFESRDGGRSWSRPRDGLEVGYLRSVAVDPGDPETVVVSASSRARTAYVAGHADGRLYRRTDEGPWRRVRKGRPERPETIAPLLAAGREAGELWAADERGVHRSGDGGERWETVAEFSRRPSNLRGLAVLSGAPDG